MSSPSSEQAKYIFPCIGLGRTVVWWWLQFGSLWEEGELDFPHSLWQASIIPAPSVLIPASPEKSMQFLFPIWVRVRVSQRQVEKTHFCQAAEMICCSFRERGDLLRSRALRVGSWSRCQQRWDALRRTTCSGASDSWSPVAAPLGFLLFQISWEQTSPALLNRHVLLRIKSVSAQNTSCLLFSWMNHDYSTIFTLLDILGKSEMLRSVLSNITPRWPWVSGDLPSRWPWVQCSGSLGMGRGEGEELFSAWG